MSEVSIRMDGLPFMLYYSIMEWIFSNNVPVHIDMIDEYCICNIIISEEDAVALKLKFGS